jgi:hypothetical protein
MKSDSTNFAANIPARMLMIDREENISVSQGFFLIGDSPEKVSVFVAM